MGLIPANSIGKFIRRPIFRIYSVQTHNKNINLLKRLTKIYKYITKYSKSQISIFAQIT